MEWIKSVLASLLQHGDFVAQILAVTCLFGVLYVIEQVAPAVTFKTKLIVYGLIICYGFCEVYGYSFRLTKKEQKETQNASILILKMTAPEGENRVQIETKLCVSKNVPEWGNGLLVKSRDLISHVFRKETE